MANNAGTGTGVGVEGGTASTGATAGVTGTVWHRNHGVCRRLWTQRTTGAGYGVYGTITGHGNTGYAGYFINTDTSSNQITASMHRSIQHQRRKRPPVSAGAAATTGTTDSAVYGVIRTAPARPTASTA